MSAEQRKVLLRQQVIRDADRRTGRAGDRGRHSGSLQQRDASARLFHARAPNRPAISPSPPRRRSRNSSTSARRCSARRNSAKSISLSCRRKSLRNRSRFPTRTSRKAYEAAARPLCHAGKARGAPDGVSERSGCARCRAEDDAARRDLRADAPRRPTARAATSISVSSARLRCSTPRSPMPPSRCNPARSASRSKGRFGTALVKVGKIEPEKVRSPAEVADEIKRESRARARPQRSRARNTTRSRTSAAPAQRSPISPRSSVSPFGPST